MNPIDRVHTDFFGMTLGTSHNPHLYSFDLGGQSYKTSGGGARSRGSRSAPTKRSMHIRRPAVLRSSKHGSGTTYFL